MSILTLEWESYGYRNNNGMLLSKYTVGGLGSKHLSPQKGPEYGNDHPQKSSRRAGNECVLKLKECKLDFHLTHYFFKDINKNMPVSGSFNRKYRILLTTFLRNNYISTSSGLAVI